MQISPWKSEKEFGLPATQTDGKEYYTFSFFVKISLIILEINSIFISVLTSTNPPPWTLFYFSFAFLSLLAFPPTSMFLS